MTKKLQRISDLPSWEGAKRQHKSADEVLGVDLIFTNVDILDGQFGDYVVATVALSEDGDEFTVSTGASQPVQVLMKAKLDDAFPFIGKFIKKGQRMIELV